MLLTREFKEGMNYGNRMVFVNFSFTDTCYTGLIGVPRNTNRNSTVHSTAVTDFIGHIVLAIPFKLFIAHIVTDKGVGRVEGLKYSKTMRCWCLKDNYIDVHFLTGR